MTEGDTAAALNTSGPLTISDPDAGEAHVVAQTNAHGTYGDFSIDANGAWTYTGNDAHNELTAGQQVQDQFTVTSQDGTATGTVTVTITGTNDAATVSSDSKSVTEGDTAAALNTSGQLTVTDPDAGEAHVVAQTNAHGTYGDFSIDANGAWTYTGNDAHNELTAGQQVQDSSPSPSQDGTATGTVTVTITGTNDAATVSSDSKSVTEGDTAAALNTSGQLTITDPDTGEAHVVAQTNAHGTYGDFSIDANGAWTYTGNGAHDELTAGQQVSDSFTVTSQDGTATGMVTVTITGTNDAAHGELRDQVGDRRRHRCGAEHQRPADDHRSGHGRGACRGADQRAWHLRRLLDRRQRRLDLHRQRRAQRADRRPAGQRQLHRHQPGRHRHRHGDGHDHRHQRRRHGELRDASR